MPPRRTHADARARSPDAVWTIEPIRTATLKTPGPEVFFQRDFNRQVDLSIYSFVLRSGARTVLVDTGLGDHVALNADIRARKGAWAGFTSERSIASALADVVIDDIVLTTFGPYAIGGLPYWPNARVVFSARGHADLERSELPLFRRKLPPDAMRRLSSPGAVRVVDRVLLHPGLEIVEVGGHSPSALGLLIETEKGRIALADPIFHSENLTRGLPLGWVESLSEWYAMFNRLGPVAGVLPIHDPWPVVVPRDKWHPDLAGLAEATGVQA